VDPNARARGHNRSLYCPCGGKQQSCFNKDVAIEWLQSIASVPQKKNLGALISKPVKDYAAYLLEDETENSLFCNPIYCILCNRCVSEEVKRFAHEEMKMENDIKVQKDPSFVPRTWDETTDATRRGALED